MNITKISTLNVNSLQNIKTLKTISVPVMLAGAVLTVKKTQPVKDYFELTGNKEINKQIFINDVIRGKDESVNDILRNFNFEQYSKKGLPLKQTRRDFVMNIIKSVMKLPNKDKIDLLLKYNLRIGPCDIDGIASQPNNPPQNSEEQYLQKSIKNYYDNNECIIKDKKVNRVLNKIIKGMPEFNMIIGKIQHEGHKYSVDIHTLRAMQIALNDKNFETLTDDGKQILKLAILMHDFGKNGRVVSPGHAVQSKFDAQRILKNYNISDDIKKRVLNHIENHHWFKNFSLGNIDSEDIKHIFNTPEDLTIAKLITKGDYQSINDIFHLSSLISGKILTQKEFDVEFEKIMSKINF